MHKKLNKEGFSLIEALVVIVVVAAIAACGWLVWRHDHKKKSSSSSSTSSQQAKSSSTSTSTVDVYAGWKSYCDTTYNYCFKYPSTWHLDVESAPQEPCDAGQIDVMSPDGSIDVSYQNDNNHDGSLAAITPTSLETMTNANQALTIVGSYFSDGTNRSPSYAVVDSSLLSSDPLTVGTSSQFPEQAEFTDQASGATTCSGSLTASPSHAVGTAQDATDWFTTSEAKTSLQVLESFYYSKANS